MIIDIHSHTREHSQCSHQSAVELIEKARDMSLDGIVITDHDFLWSPEELRAVLDQVDVGSLVVLRGQEVSCLDGHLLAYGVEETLPGNLKRREIARRVREAGGATVLAHPFRWGGFRDQADEAIADYLRVFDAIECWTTNHSPEEQKRAEGFRGWLGIHLTGASDAHSLDRVGLYATEFQTPIRNECDLAQALRTGQFAPVRFVK